MKAIVLDPGKTGWVVNRLGRGARSGLCLSKLTLSAGQWVCKGSFSRR